MKQKYPVFLCCDEFGSSSKATAATEDRARRIYFARTGGWPLRVEKTDDTAQNNAFDSLYSTAGPAVKQRRLTGSTSMLWLIPFWLLLSPLLSAWNASEFSAALSAENFFNRSSYTAYIAFVLLLLHYWKLFFSTYVFFADPQEGIAVRKLLYTAPVVALLLCGVVYYFPAYDVLEYLQVLIFVTMALVFYPWVFAFRGGWRSCNKRDSFVAMLDKWRNSSVSLAVLSLLSAPAILMAAELARYYFTQNFVEPIWPVVDAAIRNLAFGEEFRGTVNWNFLLSKFSEFVLHGVGVYAVLVLSFRVGQKRKKAFMNEKTQTKLKELDAVNSTPVYSFFYVFFVKLVPQALFFVALMFVNYGLRRYFG